jgi:alkaline phosphatase D
VAGDRHSFCAGLAAKTLPPKPFNPVGLAFVTGSISAPGVAESLEYGLPKNHPLRALYLADILGGAKPEPSINMLMLHGVRSCLEYQRSGDRGGARQLSNPNLAPHLSFLDFNGHGYSIICATTEWIDTEFSKRWSAGQEPQLEQRILEDYAGLAV